MYKTSATILIFSGQKRQMILSKQTFDSAVFSYSFVDLFKTKNRNTKKYEN